MTLTLSPRIEAMIRQKIENGRFSDATEVIEEALRQMDERDRRERLIAALEQGEIGDAVEWTPELAEELSREAEEMFLRGELPDPDVGP